jgi:hypothetical protein
MSPAGGGHWAGLRRSVAVAGLAALATSLGTGCADDDDDEDAFCEAVLVVVDTADPAELAEAYDVMEATAPTAISEEVDVFVANAREVTAAFAPVDGDDDPAALDAAAEGLSPDARAMVEDLAVMAQTRQLPEDGGSAAAVVSYAVTECGLTL